LDFLIDWDKGEFVGVEALARIEQQGVQRKLACLALDKALPVFGGEGVFLDERVVGQTTSGNFGYSVGRSLVLCYLPVDLLNETQFVVQSFDQKSIALPVISAAYDPDRKKILC